MGPAKTEISLGIRPVWSESTLSAWRKLGSLATHWVQVKTDRTGQIPRLIWVFAGHTFILLVLSCHGSNSLLPFHLLFIYISLLSATFSCVLRLWFKLCCCDVYNDVMRDSIACSLTLRHVTENHYVKYPLHNWWRCESIVLTSRIAGKWMNINKIKLLIFNALNHSSFHRCGFEPSSGYM